MYQIMEPHEVVTAMIVGMMEGGVPLGQFATGLHNAFAYGTCLEEHYTVIDEDFEPLFAAIEKFGEAARVIEEGE